MASVFNSLPQGCAPNFPGKQETLSNSQFIRNIKEEKSKKLCRGWHLWQQCFSYWGGSNRASIDKNWVTYTKHRIGQMCRLGPILSRAHFCFFSCFAPSPQIRIFGPKFASLVILDQIFAYFVKSAKFCPQIGIFGQIFTFLVPLMPCPTKKQCKREY